MDLGQGLTDQTAPTPQHITAEVLDEEVSAVWTRLVFEAQQFPTTYVCANCGSEHIADISFVDTDPNSGSQSGIHCSDCGAIEELPAERNDLSEALLIASSHPVYGPAKPQLDRRHLLALASHCLFLMESQPNRRQGLALGKEVWS
jgi:DNA-directed RNA polymerase subunit RPC12/RpoP